MYGWVWEYAKGLAQGRELVDDELAEYLCPRLEWHAEWVRRTVGLGLLVERCVYSETTAPAPLPASSSSACSFMPSVCSAMVKLVSDALQERYYNSDQAITRADVAVNQ